MVGIFVCFEKLIGFDGLLNFYVGCNVVCDFFFEWVFLNYMGWFGNMCVFVFYVIDVNVELIDCIV